VFFPTVSKPGGEAISCFNFQACFLKDKTRNVVHFFGSFIVYACAPEMNIREPPQLLISLMRFFRHFTCGIYPMPQFIEWGLHP